MTVKIETLNSMLSILILLDVLMCKKECYFSNRVGEIALFY